jgi:hypothetical protein
LSLGHLLGGATTIQAAAKKDRPAGTSWIMPVSHLASPVEALSSYGRGDDQLGFFDEFRKKMWGENFDKESLVVAAAQAGDINESATTRKEMDGESKEKEDKDDINDFFAKFEKTTGEKNIQPGWL